MSQNAPTDILPLPPAGPLEAVPEHADVMFNWRYDMSRAALVSLYEKGKRLQWNATTDIDWSIDVDPEECPEFFPPRPSTPCSTRRARSSSVS